MRIMNDTIKLSTNGLEKTSKLASTELCVSYGRTGIGGRKENQDSFGGSCVGDNVVLTVCDGMGGMNGGQTASKIAKIEIVETMVETPVDEWNEEAVRKAVIAANEAVYQRALHEPALRGMGTTATVLLLTPEAAYLTHIGDSRIYLLRNGKKVFRTFDHSKVFEMVEQKILTEEQARCSSFSNIITQALGIRPEVKPKVEKIPYKKGDRFILCCDGIWNCEPENVIIDYFKSERHTDKEVDFLTEKVNGIGIANGGNHDNLTAIVADMNINSKFQHSPIDKIKKFFSKGLAYRKK